MPKTIIVDKIDLVELRIVKDPAEPGKRLQVFARYNLQSGNSVIQTHYREISGQLSAFRQATAASLFDSMLAEIAAIEQV